MIRKVFDLIHFVCIHGNLGSPVDWREVAATLEHGVKGASFDLPNLWNLGSPEPIDELASLVSAAKSKGKRVIVVGYSLGARLTLELLARKEGAIDGAVLCSVSPGLADPAARRDRLASDSRWADMVANLDIPWLSIVSEWNSQAVFTGSRPMVDLPFTSPDEERSVRGAIARRFREWSLGALPSRWTTLETVKCPVLCLAGERDTKFRLILESIERISNPHLVCGVVPGVGHRLPLDNPEALGIRIALFLGAGGNRAGV